MDEEKLKEIEMMIAIVYKRIDDFERKEQGGWRSASMSSYLEELRKKAQEAIKYNR